MTSVHDRIYVAVAWGYNGELADELLKHSAKFESVTFGVSFCQTDAGLINRLVGVRNAFVAEGDGSTFHPKIYYFETDGKAEVILGSSNFTQGGLSRNWEACVHAAGDASNHFFDQVRQCLLTYQPLRKSITPEVAAAYQVQFDAAKKIKRAKDPILSSKEAPWLTSNLVNMTWDEFVKAVKRDRFHTVDDRLGMLRECQSMFAAVKSFDELSVLQWKAIAGVIGTREKEANGLDKFDWGWFGSMKGMGDFNQRVKFKDPWLARAVDCIPPIGDVSRDDFTRYCGHFVKAFEKSARVGGVPTATRLLAMKRPDKFVCISNPNKAALSMALSSSKDALGRDFESYWETVIEPIRQSRWYNQSRPAGQEAELWDRRVAMLDAIYYHPL